MAKFKCGDKVVDLGGFKGVVVRVTLFESSVWYDVRFSPRSVSVRYDSDLTLQA